VAEDADSIAWMRARWEERGVPKPQKFAAMVSVLRATAIMNEEVDRILAEQKLHRTAYLLLITLQMTEGSARPLGQLSKRLLVHPTTVTSIIDQLEQDGIVVRKPHPTDRRTVMAELTKKGHRATAAASAALAEADFGLSGIDDRTADRLTEDLRRLRRGLGDQQ
jgi:DNA-binding MarR family transcriptional regulator